jgi:hypothetical protein
MTRSTCASRAALLAGLIVLPVSCVAADSGVRAKFGYDSLADCQVPAVHDLPVRVEGIGSLSVDRHASVDVTGSVMGIAAKQEHLDVTLGGRPVAAENGAASLRVMGRRHLQAVRTFPNNSITIDLYVTGTVCVLKVDHRLKPGKRQYTFPNPFGGLAYCSRPRTIKTSCEPL